jgi:hypothetical protein
MTTASKTEVAQFETTRRLLSHLVNEGLCLASLEVQEADDVQWLCLTSTKSDSGNTSMVKVQYLPREKVILNDASQVASVVRPHQLRPPVLLLEGDQDHRSDLDPGVIFKFVYPWFETADDETMRDQIAQELLNAAANQGMSQWTSLSSSAYSGRDLAGY